MYRPLSSPSTFRTPQPRQGGATAALLAASLILAGCSGGEDADASEPEPTFSSAPSSSAQETGDASRFDTDDIAELLRAEPGPLDPEDDAEEIIDRLTETFGEDIGEADPDEVFLELLNLAAADYREVQQYIDDVEVEFTDPGSGPDDAGVEDTGESVESGQSGGLDLHVLFDSSGSMGDELDGERKIDTAVSAVQDFIGDAAGSDNVQVGLLSYGDVSGDNCGSTEELYPLDAYDETRFNEALESQKPGDATPIATALEDVLDDVNAEHGDVTDRQTVVYVVSDGKETCHGDPVAAAKALADSDAEAVVNIIGFDVSDDEQQSLKDIAESGNGEYHRADSGDELRDLMREERSRTIDAWRTWQSENVDRLREEQSTVVDKSREIQSSGVDTSRAEQTALIAIVDELQERSEDGVSLGTGLRSSAVSRGTSIRSYLVSTLTSLRSDAVSEGTSLRSDVVSEGTGERSRIISEGSGQ
ncbi:MAG TPA: VWA domain-containing protein [Candidatus Corynebacterium avicola]|uniref:VWA domain-containing protein n=1 Tax=Candidatus Corynebacterium avicola TaxID=2838527 RepID=A0A9D1RQN1_9CORY|nr:VWA domain-containing protein [Candidatus Corynebacterium avicola]